MNKWKPKDRDDALVRLRGSGRWKKLRAALLALRPLCEVCRRIGVPRPATEVHHVIPARQMVARYGDEGFFAEWNLVPLCEEHHERNELAYKNGTAEVLFGVKLHEWEKENIDK